MLFLLPLAPSLNTPTPSNPPAATTTSLTGLRQAPCLRAGAPGPLDTFFAKRRREHNERGSLVWYSTNTQSTSRLGEMKGLCLPLSGGKGHWESGRLWIDGDKEKET